jgi:hypothetical protein
VLLSGAHTLGHVNAENSNYDGHPGWKPADYPKADPITVNAWDRSPTVFDNDYYFQVRDIVSSHAIEYSSKCMYEALTALIIPFTQPWATIYNNGSTFATGRTNSNIWIDMSCGGDINSYPTATTVNTCLTEFRPLARMMIALNTGYLPGFALIFVTLT